MAYLIIAYGENDISERFSIEYSLSDAFFTSDEFIEQGYSVEIQKISIDPREYPYENDHDDVKTILDNYNSYESFLNNADEETINYFKENELLNYAKEHYNDGKIKGTTLIIQGEMVYHKAVPVSIYKELYDSLKDKARDNNMTVIEYTNSIIKNVINNTED